MANNLSLARMTDTSALSGKQKAAILCMVLGSDSASKLTQKLFPDEVEAISYEIARLEHVKGELADAVLSEWVESSLAAGYLAEGGVDYARDILEKAFGSHKAGAVLKRVQSQLTENLGLHRLRNADPQQLAHMLRGEHPQTVALVLAHIDTDKTASILKEIDPVLGSEVVYRMAKMEKGSPEMLQLIERSLGSEMDLASSQGTSLSGGPAAVAAVLNLLNASLEKELLDGVAERDPALCEQIKNLMFVFEDIQSLDDRSLQRLLREMDTKELALALKAASGELKTRITGVMSQRAAEALNEEMELLGPVRMRDVEAAQSNIVAQVRRLEEAGEIVVGGAADDLVV
jgi:flagellar motor switch protein FliG